MPLLPRNENFSIVDIDPLEVARQMTLIEFEVSADLMHMMNACLCVCCVCVYAHVCVRSFVLVGACCGEVIIHVCVCVVRFVCACFACS